MNATTKTLLFLVLCFVTIAVPATRASWAPDGVALCTPANWQGYPAIVADGTGGGFVTWAKEGSGAVSIYAQRIGGDGSTLWGEEGAAVCTAPYAQYNAELAVDGVGGAIIVWHDIRSLNLDIYAQRVDAAGEAKWAADGVAICTAAGDQTDPLIVSDDSGGAIIAWVDGRSGSLDIYAQRIDAAGVAQWAPGGVAVCVAPGAPRLWSLIPDGAGGAILAWHDPRTGTPHVYCQRLDATGAALWAANGLALSSLSWSQTYPVAASDGASGAIFAWQDSRNGNTDVYAQRVDATGVAQWTANGVALCALSGNQDVLSILSDGAAGAIVAWRDGRSLALTDIYAQKVHGSGVVAWQSNGVAVCTASGKQEDARVISGSSDGAIVVWTDRRNLTNDIYAQRLNASGASQWAVDGVALCAATGEQTRPRLVPDDTGGAIVTWLDQRNFDNAIYAQRVGANGQIGGFIAGVPGPIAFALRCTPNPFNPRTTIKYDLPEAGHVRLSVFDVAGRLVRTLVDESMPQGSHEAVWDGRDSAGRELGSSSYLARLEFERKVETIRMGLIR